ncbi:MAG: arginine deiminase [Spirochaetia bacterium]|nr:arginine deiminase [Spirochaetia bacterium]
MKSGCTLQIYSEIGPLKSVLLHRPGSELETLTPKYLDTMLFEDIPFLDSMREEHNAFAAALQNNGCEVLYVEDLLLDTVKNTEIRKSLIEKTVRTAGIPDLDLCESLQNYLLEMDDMLLTRHLIAGTKKDEIALNQHTGRRDLSYYIRDEYPFYINPLPNLYFTRDPGSIIGERCSINTMQTDARKRESMILSAIMQNHPIFKTEDSSPLILEGYAEGSSIEGGDILVLDKYTVAIGCSARTEAWAIEELAKRILIPVSDSDCESSGFKNILVIQIPFTRAYMHLDTVFTMVDHDKFTIYPGVESVLRTFTISMGKGRKLQVKPENGLKAALQRALKLVSVDLIQTGGGDRITAAREQWNDSANTLAISPGVVVTYRRNVVSNDTLEKHGITVLPIRGSELVRGRGGPRCMSMPLVREAIS